MKTTKYNQKHKTKWHYNDYNVPNICSAHYVVKYVIYST